MKFLVISDIHGNTAVTDWANSVADEEDVDLIMVLGDVTDFGPEKVAEKILAPLERDVYSLPGNCDPPSVHETISGWTMDMHGKTADIDGFHIAGLGGSNISPFQTPFELDEDTIYSMLKPISKKGMILMVHAPPYGVNDMIPSGVNVGSRAILKIVDEFRPILVLSGHIHEDYGVKYINGTTFVNPGPAHDGMYAIVEIDDGAVKAELFTVPN